jgi:hypothetical protein
VTHCCLSFFLCCFGDGREAALPFGFSLKVTDAVSRSRTSAIRRLLIIFWSVLPS